MRKYIFLILLLFNSCVTIFKVVDTGHKLKGKKIAVISGLFDKRTSLYAHKLGEHFKKNSKFKIINQKRIKKILGTYPVRIKGPYGPSAMELNEDYSATDVKTLISMGKKVKADYVYAVWVPTGVVHDNKHYELFAVTQMFEVATGKEIGRGKHKVVWTTGAYIGWGMPRNMNAAMEQMADVVTKEVSKKMKMAKKAKKKKKE